ncbi:hyalin-like isoform X2 [Asterias rubens]|uniref:hyalin-like isoform X2 n=1 Tax=Asterias rubens TaxID=7604 RepID=UPI0014550C94|nr:hyalin-like isoform X2 [Asterias rubens]
MTACIILVMVCLVILPASTITECPRGTYKSNNAEVSKCTPCPPHSTTTAEGSTSPSACECLEGYFRAEDKTCKVKRCPRLRSPSNGRIRPDVCENTYESECSFECNLGYELFDPANSARRRCKANGLWSGDRAQCRKVSCDEIPTPTGGTRLCLNQDGFLGDVYGSTCSFSCKDGFNEVGDRERECTESGEWSGTPFSCRAITCPTLPSLRNGNIVPAKCGEKRQKVKLACAFSCEDGYRLQGPLTKRCQTTGNWSSDEQVACVDAIPPEITCPELIVRNAEPGLSSAEVTWDMPVYSDNVDGTDALTVTVHPAGLKPSHRFEIGSVRVRYTVTDTAGLSAECYFKVVILDTQPPTVENCPDEMHETSYDKISAVTWDEPQFTDNSKGDLNLTHSHQPGVELAWGVHIVTYTATDAAGLESECRFRIRISPKTCPILIAETHTRIAPPDCMERQLDYKSQCFYECDCGFHLRGVSSRTCQADGTWSDPSVQNTCIDIEPPEFITCPGDISLPTDLNENFATNPANWNQPEARDNDGEPVIEASLSATQQRFYLDEVTVITYTARDETGLENTCTFSVTVKDEEPPQVINCPNSMAVKTNNRLAVVHWEEPVFQDNSGHDASVIYNRPPGSTFFFGQPESIWYIAEDHAGNTARCEFTVSEEDLEPPEFLTCPEDIVLPANLHENFTTTTWDRPEARDNLGTPTIEASPSAAKERFYLDEVTVVTYTARDRSGLQTTCTFSITVTDEEPPQVVSCPGSMVIKTQGSSEIVHWEEPVFQDNSGKEVTVINSDLPSGFTFFCGLIETVYYIAEDQAGNKAICEFTVDLDCMN